MKYPNILFFRHSYYKDIDSFFYKNNENLLCSINLTDKKEDLNKLYNPNYPLLITYGDYKRYKFIVDVIPYRFFKRWIHYELNKLPEINEFNRSVNFCFIHNIMNVENNRISFSMFTTCYKSFHKIVRAYDSIKAQEFVDWEWVVLDDTPNDTEPNHFEFLTKLFENDNRVRLYKRANNSGNIGNVKNEAVLLCRGKYVLEMDHDDELVPFTLRLAYDAFEKDPEVGFVFMNTVNLHEDGRNFHYGNHYSLGYGGYYCQKHGNSWVYVASMANINDVTLSHIVSIPNHPRIWRKDTLIKIGNYCEILPVCDDYELFLRTALSGCKMVKINEIGYIQYMNEGYNNFSYIRNSEINRLCRNIYPMYYDQISKYINDDNKGWKQIWKLDPEKYEHKYSNTVIGHDKYKKQMVFIGLETLWNYIEKNPTIIFSPNIDYIVLDNKTDVDTLTNLLSKHKLDMFKCFSMTDVTENELVNYFKLIVSNGGEYEMILKENV